MTGADQFGKPCRNRCAVTRKMHHLEASRSARADTDVGFTQAERTSQKFNQRQVGGAFGWRGGHAHLQRRAPVDVSDYAAQRVPIGSRGNAHSKANTVLFGDEGRCVP
jgi:hypothetical protein